MGIVTNLSANPQKKNKTDRKPGWWVAKGPASGWLAHDFLDGRLAGLLADSPAGPSPAGSGPPGWLLFLAVVADWLCDYDSNDEDDYTDADDDDGSAGGGG